VTGICVPRSTPAFTLITGIDSTVVSGFGAISTISRLKVALLVCGPAVFE